MSSRTYISKLERGQSSPTLEMMATLGIPLSLSPLTLMAITIGTETAQSIRSLVRRIEEEAADLARAGVLRELDIPHADVSLSNRITPRVQGRQALKHTRQTAFSFMD